MAERPIWRGHLRLALVSCPVALFSTYHDSSNLHFHFINPGTGHRVRMVTMDAETDQEIGRRDLVRGYEFKKDHYLILTDEDFASARIDSSSVLSVEKFVDAAAIDPIYFDSSYFVAPDGDAGADVFAVLREAIVRSGKLALSHVVISRRERAVVLRPIERGLVAHTLHESRDLRDAASVFSEVPHAKPDPEMVDLALQLVKRQASHFDPADLTDRYEARLRDVIEAKLRGEGIEPLEDTAPESNVIDLMAALRQSLGGGDDKPARAKPRPAKVSAPPPAKEKPTRSTRAARR